MSRPRYYSPAIKRHLVTALYYEAQKQGKPMTVVANEILERGLREADPLRSPESGWSLRESPPPSSSNENEQPPRP
jgi:hypothetical protein